jgi:hypothetical protein
MILLTGLALAVGVSGLAYADGASDNVSTVIGKVGPRATAKLPKKTFKATSLKSGVTTLDEDNSPAIPAEAAEEVYLDYDDDIKIKLAGVPECTQPLQGTTTEEANGLCGSSRVSVAGSAKARIPMFPAPNNEVSDLTVTAYHGTGNHLLLHAYSPTLTSANTQVVDGQVIKSPKGGDFGQRLSVPNAPDVAGDAGALVYFAATIKHAGVVFARCHDRNRTLNFAGKWVYDDASEDTAKASQKCKVS